MDILVCPTIHVEYFKTVVIEYCILYIWSLSIFEHILRDQYISLIWVDVKR